MSIAEVTSSVGVVSYGRVDWDDFKWIDGVPLEYLLSHGIPVYCKINRGLHFAYRYQWSLRPRQRSGTVNSLAPTIAEYATMGKDEELLFLQLDDEDLCEILATGSRGMVEFSVGGLRLIKAEVGGSGRIEFGLADVDFHRCYLINHQRWRSAVQDAPIFRPPRHEDYAEPLRIGYEDLYLRSDDLVALKNLRHGVGVEREPYPFATDGRELPAPLYWLYQAAFSINRDGEAGRDADMTKAWLRANTPGKMFVNRWIRTGASLIPLDYKFVTRFDEKRLVDFRIGETLKNPHVSLPLTFALAIAEWWMDEESTCVESKRIELSGLLADVGFSESAMYDLTAMISGKAVSDKEKPEFDKLHFQLQRKKLRSGKHPVGDDAAQINWGGSVGAAPESGASDGPLVSGGPGAGAGMPSVSSLTSII